MLYNDNVNINIKSNLQKNIKTVIFSELPKYEKMKYFNFLLENEINFNKDDAGSYIATVKVLNPQYYADKEKHRNNANHSNHFEDNEHKDKEDKSIVKGSGGRSSSVQNKNNSSKKIIKKKKIAAFEKQEVKRVIIIC